MNKKESFDQKQCNYKLYKAKKQWITACATVIVALGASAFISTNVSADMTSNSTNQVVEENANSAVSIVSNDSSKVDTVTGSNDNVLTQEDSDQDTTIELGGNEQTLYSGRAFGSTSEDEAQFDGSNFLDLKINNEE